MDVISCFLVPLYDSAKPTILVFVSELTFPGGIVSNLGGSTVLVQLLRNLLVVLDAEGEFIH